MSKTIKLLLSALICSSVICANAQSEKEQIELAITETCKPLLEKKCKQSKCMDLNLFIDFTYKRCTDNVTDFPLFNNKDSRLPNSEIGYLIKFGNLEYTAIVNNPVEPYLYYQKEYKILKDYYASFIIINEKDFLAATNLLKSKKEKKIRDNFINDYKSVISKINSRIEKLDLMLQSEVSFNNYRDSHLKFMPDIVIEGKNDKFKNKEFSVAECSFLKLHFDSDFQKKLNFTCEK